MRAVFIGSVEFSQKLYGVIRKSRGIELVGVVTKASSTFNSDFFSLAPLAAEDGVDCFLYNNDNKAQVDDWILKRKPDVVFCLGWSHLLGKKLLLSVPQGVIGYHPAALPFNRGRHPIIWALCLGLKETASSFFVMDEGADSGDLVHQVKVKISSRDTAATLYARLNKVATKQLKELCLALAAGKMKRKVQDHGHATYWRKRDEKDGQIDWRMGTTTLLNLIRALTRPYPGASFIHGGKAYRVWKAKPSSAKNRPNWEPGKVLSAGKSSLTVKTGDGFIDLMEHDLKDEVKTGDYLS